jgi:chemotaxis protein methyltransferase CheR
MPLLNDAPPAASPFALRSINLTEPQFEKISDMVKSLCGINLHTGKKELVKARLGKRMRALGLYDLDEYLDHVAQDPGGVELTAMLDALSTNLTHFFREPAHFHYLRSEVLPALLRRPAPHNIRIWSAGCSSGEEPYSIAITLSEAIPHLDRVDARILATDLSTRVLAHAREGVYPRDRLKDLPPMTLARAFLCERHGKEDAYRVTDGVRRLVSFSRLNLMAPWPMRGPFDVVFCRNVMIYFDKPTQERLVRRFWDLLSPGGHLFIGHSESLAGVKHPYRYVRPTIYQK